MVGFSSEYNFRAYAVTIVIVSIWTIHAFGLKRTQKRSTQNSAIFALALAGIFWVLSYLRRRTIRLAFSFAKLLSRAGQASALAIGIKLLSFWTWILALLGGCAIDLASFFGVALAEAVRIEFLTVGTFKTLGCLASAVVVLVAIRVAYACAVGRLHYSIYFRARVWVFVLRPWRAWILASACAIFGIPFDIARQRIAIVA